MSAMRLLILGILNDDTPRHGYQIRQHLEAWNTDKWANIGYGSIYFALKKMAQEDLLQVVTQDNTTENSEKSEKPDKSEKIIYQITPAGKEHFVELLRKQWWEMRSIIDPFQIAVSFMHYMDPQELREALEHRAEGWKLIIKTSERMMPSCKTRCPKAPPSVEDNFRLIIAHHQAELVWIENMLEKLNNQNNTKAQE